MGRRLGFCVPLLLMAGCVSVRMSGPPLPQAPTMPAVQAIASYEFGDSRMPLTTVEEMVTESLNSGDTAIADELAAVLTSDSTYAAKQFALRELALIGTERHVDAIAPLLVDPELSDMARYALEPIPGRRVDRALVDALGAAPDALRPGIINSLAARDTRSAADDIARFAGSRDPAVSEAAESALAKLRG